MASSKDLEGKSPHIGGAMDESPSRAVPAMGLTRTRREVISVLSGVNDLMLDDIGITRSEIRILADGTLKLEPQHLHRRSYQGVRSVHGSLGDENLAKADDARPAA